MTTFPLATLARAALAATVLLFNHTAAAQTAYFIHADHLNTPRLLTDQNQAVVWRWDPTEPFGDSMGVGSMGRDGFVVTVPLRFPGQYFDKETNLDYNYFRDYDPAIGRYVESDPIGLRGGVNTYAYVTGNPLSFSDPLGLNPYVGAVYGAEFGTAIFPGVGTVIGAGIGLVGGYIVADQLGKLIFAKPPENAYDPNGPKAPGKPGEAEGFRDPKNGENWVPNPNPGRGGSSHGWQDEKGDVWCPSGQGGRSHGGPHWDVQSLGGGYRNVRPVRR